MSEPSLHQRLLTSYKYLYDNGFVHSQTEFAEMIGKQKTHVNAAFKNVPKRCTIGLMESIADAFPDILNRNYLLAGEGEVVAPDKTMRPHFEAKACAGFMYGVAEGEVGTMHPHIYGMRDYDFTIEAEGNSMLPRIESGDLLVCRKSEDRANPPIGKICVVDGKDGAVVKVIVSADDVAGVITLHSLNPAYDDFNVPFSDILGIAEVVGLVRSF